MNLSQIAMQRYSTKAFDPNKKIPTEDFEQLKDLLRLSPSSVNSQPWHFVIASSAEAIERVRKSTHGSFSFNDARAKDASHIIIFCTKTNMDDDYLLHLLATEDKDGRFPEAEIKEMVRSGRSRFVNLHQSELNDIDHWMEKQVYLNMGSLLLGAAALGIDALTMEGIDKDILNQEFQLLQKGFRATAAIALGYRSDTDFNATLPKSRLREEEVFTIL